MATESDDAILMTGPVAYDYEGLFDPSTGAGRVMNKPVIQTFGCRLNAYESEVIRDQLGQVRRGQHPDHRPADHRDEHLRGHGRGRSAGTAGHPQGAAGEPRCRTSW
jgi:hypothetical protein